MLVATVERNERGSSMKKKSALILVCIITGIMVLTGCAKTSAKSGDIQIKEGSISGTVQSVDDDKITLTLAGNMGGGMPGGQQPPNMPGSSQQDQQSSGDQTQSGDNSQQNNQQPPEKPDSDSNQQSDDNNQQPPEKPESDSNQQSDDNSQQDGGQQDQQNNNGGQPQQGQGSDEGVTIVITVSDESVLQDSDGKTVKLSEIEEGSSLTVTTDDDGDITKIVIGEAQQQGGGQASAPTEYAAANTYTEDTTVEHETLTSKEKDENVALVQNNATVTLDGVTVERENDESTGGDSASFYGVGAAVLTTEGTVKVKDAKITTNANGAAGVFAYGENSTAYVDNTTIKTSKGTSGGLHVAGGGKLYASDNTVTTAGESSAAIRSDRGGGTMVIDGGRYTSKGTGSPAIYCTADITVKDSTLTSTNSEGLCIEGKNATRLYDCDLTSSQTENEQNDNVWNLIVYQSMSGDAEDGEGTLIIDGGSITAKEGGMFYTTNTQSVITLSDVDINYPDETDYFLRCTGNANKRGWGSTGSNGADCTFTADDQEMKGDIVYDSISDLHFYMVNGSSLEGAFTDDESCAGNGGDGSCNVVIDKSSVWTVTGDSAVTSLSNAGKIIDANGKTVTIKGTDGKVYVKGDSKYTVTVEKYSEEADTSGVGKTGSFEQYAG